MTITLTFAAWWIPAIITAVALFWAIFIVDDGGGMFSGISNIFALVPALFVSCVSWIIYAVFK